MACCCVEIIGKDGKKHTLTTDATSAYDAVEKAIHAWCLLWWWSSEVVAIVRVNDETWNISVSKVIAASGKKRRLN